MKTFEFTLAGVRVPAFLYGTAWKEDATESCVAHAISSGFRGIDTANQRKHYFEAGVGAALKKAIGQGAVRREELFLQTKFTSLGGQDNRLPYDLDAAPAVQVRQSFESSLEHLGTDYLDSYVLHGPSSLRGLGEDDWEIWRAMETLQREGKAKLLGVSNVSLEQLRLLQEGAAVKPAFVQNRCFARTGWDREVRTFCNDHGILYQGFSLLTANREIFRNPKFIELVQRVGCTPAQAVFRFAHQMKMLPLTGTTDPAHMREDLDALNFELKPEELKVIENLSL